MRDPNEGIIFTAENFCFSIDIRYLIHFKYIRCLKVRGETNTNILRKLERTQLIRLSSISDILIFI